MIEELASLLSATARATGAPALARYAGASHLCLFLLDPELKKFLPAPGFPSTLPSGLQWRQLLQGIAVQEMRRGHLPSPFSDGAAPVTVFRFQADALVVLFGPDADPARHPGFLTGMALLAALCLQEVRTALSEGTAALAHQSAMQAEILARSLGQAHDQLSEVVRTKSSLLNSLSQQEARLELARKISGMAVWEWDLATNTVFPGAQFLEMHGLEHDPALNFEHVIGTIHPDDRARVLQEIHSAVRGRKDYDVQFRVVWKNGIIRSIAARAIVVKDGHGNPRSLVGFSIDITNRLMIENALIRSEKLAAAGRLAASIAHEINNPLASIVNVVYLAKNELDPERVRAYLEMADRELQRISGVTRQTLRFYQDSNWSTRFDMRSAVEEVVQLFAKQIADSGVSVVTQFRLRNAQVVGWPGELKQVVSNLLLNAIYATPAHKRVTLRLKRVGECLQLSVADEGMGIVREQRPRIFEPFYSTKNESGTGLGLWVTLQIVNKHGGRIRMKSRTGTPGSGTVFTVSLPLKGRPDLNEPELHAKWQDMKALAPPPGDRRIALLPDEPDQPAQKP